MRRWRFDTCEAHAIIHNWRSVEEVAGHCSTGKFNLESHEGEY